MAAAQLTATSVSSRGLPTFEGLRPSAIKIAAFAPLKQGLSQRCFRPLVVKAATVVAPKVLLLVIDIWLLLDSILFCYFWLIFFFYLFSFG